jgi:hypothetical protein
MVMALAGCAPLTPTPAFHFGETGETMPRGRVALAAAGGVGSFETIGGGVGLGARVRYGVGAGHELRLEGVAIARINDDEPDDPQQQMERPWQGKSTAWLYKLSWKKDVTRWLAGAGAGGSHSATGNALGAMPRCWSPRACSRFGPAGAASPSRCRPAGAATRRGPPRGWPARWSGPRLVGPPSSPPSSATCEHNRGYLAPRRRRPASRARSIRAATSDRATFLRRPDARKPKIPISS